MGISRNQQNLAWVGENWDFRPKHLKDSDTFSWEDKEDAKRKAQHSYDVPFKDTHPEL